MKKIVIIGSGGHTKYIIDIVESERKYKIAGLIDEFNKEGDQALGYTILGKEEDLPILIKKHSLMGVIIGVGDNFLRSKVADRMTELCPELSFVNAIHPSAYIAKYVNLGQGTVIYPGQIVGPGCSIGRFCILFTNSSLGHDSTMDSFASLGAGAVTGGYCKIGAFTAISVGSALSDRIIIGEHTVVGAGSTVLKNIDSYRVAYGTPAKVIRERQKGEKYM